MQRSTSPDHRLRQPHAHRPSHRPSRTQANPARQPHATCQARSKGAPGPATRGRNPHLFSSPCVHTDLRPPSPHARLAILTEALPAPPTARSLGRRPSPACVGPSLSGRARPRHARGPRPACTPPPPHPTITGMRVHTSALGTIAH